MITEDYVSFEIAKLLKKKGFDEATLCDYSDKGLRWFNDILVQHNSQGGIACPTLHMTMKWLREVHNLFVFPFPQINTNKFWVEIYQLSDNQEWKNLYCESIDLQNYPTHEKACEAAIKYCLENLI
jgi:hypothetical protein